MEGIVAGERFAASRVDPCFFPTGLESHGALLHIPSTTRFRECHALTCGLATFAFSGLKGAPRKGRAPFWFSETSVHWRWHGWQENVLFEGVSHISHDKAGERRGPIAAMLPQFR
ncbi:hypothetical protein MRS76_04220 [Rhizobiaceae bacterium n13]|uniref:Uncharacterized protein n=1 Tax=Ferirhizobium litorale TaxID=2927786 RepID=A0AAE3QAI2_9HYPH|nr:hypothetical protein [Fererhizobium litorale]MDI7861154.1 hypothetical protein [Fererhizobium litorale]MDI7921301.1 hypothetical protein [Fererhizobium litorale]